MSNIMSVCTYIYTHIYIHTQKRKQLGRIERVNLYLHNLRSIFEATKFYVDLDNMKK